MTRRCRSQRRSGCPVSVSLDVFGDHWSLLIIRDLMVRGYRSFGEFLSSGEGIATNILADRLHRLADAGILSTESSANDGRAVHYRLTPKGIALAPVLLELLIWGARHEETGAPCSFVTQMEQNREAVLAETYRRWEQRDLTPLIPPFRPPEMSSPEMRPAAETSPARVSTSKAPTRKASPGKAFKGESS